MEMREGKREDLKDEKFSFSRDVNDYLGFISFFYSAFSFSCFSYPFHFNCTNSVCALVCFQWWHFYLSFTLVGHRQQREVEGGVCE